jgi:hypothetical protein
MSAIWTAAVVFVLSASLCFRVLIITRYRERVYAPEWLGPALLGLMLAVAGFILITALLLPSSRSVHATGPDTAKSRILICPVAASDLVMTEGS